MSGSTSWGPEDDSIGVETCSPYCSNIQGYSKWLSGYNLSSGNSAPNSGNSHRLTVPFEGAMHSFKRQGAYVSRNWRYESEPPMKPSPLTCGTNSIIVLMFVESQRVHIWRPVRYVTKTWSVVVLNKKKKIHILLSQVYCVWQVVKPPTISLNNPLF